jgi:hypothetical protein
VREVLTLIHVSRTFLFFCAMAADFSLQTDKAFVDALWHDYNARVD